MSDEVKQRERDFWDHAVPSLDEVVERFRQGPEPAAAAMLEACEPLKGLSVLDFACGGGVTSLWLAERGAEAVGIDLSPASIAVARAAAEHVGLQVEFRVLDGIDGDLGGPYDRIIGHWALHHVDVAAVSRRLAAALRPGGVASFVETTADSPVLRLARRHLVGRLGVPRYGTVDEHPLTHEDRVSLERAFGSLEVSSPRYEFLWMIDRQVLHFRYPRLSRAISALDLRLSRLPATADWSYTKLFVARKPE